MDVMGDCNGMDFLSLNVLNYDEIDPDLWAYWTSTGKILKKKKNKTKDTFYFTILKNWMGLVVSRSSLL